MSNEYSANVDDIKAKYKNRERESLAGNAILAEPPDQYDEEEPENTSSSPNPPPRVPPKRNQRRVVELESEERGGGAQQQPRKSRKKIWIAVGILAIAVLFVLIFVAAFSPSHNDQPSVPRGPIGFWTSPRLPPSLSPTHYSVSISADMVAMTFSGSVVVSLNVLEDTDIVVIHGVGLNLTSATLQSTNNPKVTSGPVTANSIVHIPNFQYYIISFVPLLDWISHNTQTVDLTIAFTGILTNGLAGFYSSSYQIANGTTQTLLATQFEPIDARAAFPCFDEPALKATFDISLTYDSSYFAISNMPVKSSLSVPNPTSLVPLVQTTFMTTPNMSTYLVCFVISRLSPISTTYTRRDLSTVVISLYTTPDTLYQGYYALNMTVASLIYYEGLFGMNYPLPKLDVVAIPNFAAGAMENLGIITFRQTALLFDPDESSAGNQQRVSEVIAHEMAHQWFGDIVTAQWWSDLWLNEGFATFEEKFSVNAANPTWEILAQTLVDLRMPAMAMDALNSTHPLANNFTNPEDLGQAFDSITYEKGASLLFMLQSILNRDAPSNFERGLQQYLAKFKYSNAQTSDLWAVLSQVSSEDVNVIMANWMTQPGFPYINVTQDSSTSVALTQHRFTLQLAGPNVTIADPTWFVPVLGMGRADLANIVPTDYRLENVRTKRFWFDWGRQQYLLLNTDGRGYYRTYYDPTSAPFTLIVNDLYAVPNSVIPASARAVLVDDMLSFVQASAAPIKPVLNMTKFLRGETDYVVWSAALTGMSFISDKIQLSECSSEFSLFVSYLLHDAAMYVGWQEAIAAATGQPYVDTDTHTQSLMRSMILLNAGINGVPEVVAAARQIWGYAINASLTNYSVPADLRDFVYRTVVSAGADKEYKWVLQRYLTSTIPSESTRCLIALTYTQHPNLLWSTLQMTLGPNVRSQDIPIVISYIANNVYGRDLAWNFFRQNTAALTAKLSGSLGTLGDCLYSIARHFSTPIELQDVQNWVTWNSIAGISQAVAQSIEAIQINIQWLQNNEKDTCDFLDTWTGF